MARARSPNSIEAEEMYKNGMKLVDIAKKLDVPASTVRRWKSTQNWDGKTKGKKNERSQKKKANARHKGGQPGNRNAVGNKGGPLKPGDKIAEKHGAYSSVYWDVLDESEKDMIEDIPMDEEMLLIEQIQLFAVRERRIMIAINKYRNMKGEVSLYGFNRSESKRTFKTEEDKLLYEERIEKKISAEERLPGDGIMGDLEYIKELFNVKEWGQVFDIMHFIANFSYRGHLLCPCGSGKRLRNCHGDILMKVMNAGLKTECKEILIELKRIYDRKGN